jgi:hypothetical protein
LGLLKLCKVLPSTKTILFVELMPRSALWAASVAMRAPCYAGGGDCLVKMSLDPELDGVTGAYFNNKTTGTPFFSPGHVFQRKLPSEEAQNEAEATKLWNLSSQLVGLEA